MNFGAIHHEGTYELVINFSLKKKQFYEYGGCAKFCDCA
jgi:hypothetical protein